MRAATAVLVIAVLAAVAALGVVGLPTAQVPSAPRFRALAERALCGSAGGKPATKSCEADTQPVTCAKKSGTECGSMHCPHKNGVCCGDSKTCCPEGYKCARKHETCAMKCVKEDAAAPNGDDAAEPEEAKNKDEAEGRSVSIKMQPTVVYENKSGKKVAEQKLAETVSGKPQNENSGDDDDEDEGDNDADGKDVEPMTSAHPAKEGAVSTAESTVCALSMDEHGGMDAKNGVMRRFECNIGGAECCPTAAACCDSRNGWRCAHQSGRTFCVHDKLGQSAAHQGHHHHLNLEIYPQVVLVKDVPSKEDEEDKKEAADGETVEGTSPEKKTQLDEIEKEEKEEEAVAAQEKAAIAKQEKEEGVQAVAASDEAEGEGKKTKDDAKHVILVHNTNSLRHVEKKKGKEKEDEEEEQDQEKDE